ncbi:hypothetical protein P280DRAFT_515559 [Massarina eburnea CBS 473.64]|uniref:2-dehydropantoate 2-reductase n=1 Tax=Massarina eburnea CBS 473.64 TaxID=1395130 RepID=A0A6A6S693_9PLEO|nr:hypothetical protein P280DRAFT_515559 [Massarina eburnea CBS 473.64]
MKSWWGPEGGDPQAKQGIHAAQDENQSSNDEKENSKSSRNPAEFYRVKPVLDRRIHVLGMGNVGKFIAHSLRSIVPNPPPVTIIFHEPQMLSDWEASRQRLNLVTDGDTEFREGFEAELARLRSRSNLKEGQQTNTGNAFPEASGEQAQVQESEVQEGESSEPINSLILCTKATQIYQALSSVKHRLHPESVILFLQNGMGVVEAVNKEVFPDPATRPHYMVGINSHGMHGVLNDPFTTVHAGFGTISLGILPHERDREPAPYASQLKFKAQREAAPVKPAHAANPDPMAAEPAPVTFHWTPNHRYLLRTLLRAPVLGATAYSPPDLLQMQLEKLAVNCIINPLTVMLDARNGSILYNYNITRVMRLLLSEISLVIRSLPELQYIPNVQQRFDPGRLETMVVGIANRTQDNISSMLADVRAGKQTEVDFINGWVVKRGEELGVRCLMNYMLACLVKGKRMMVELELEEGIPFVQPRANEGSLVVGEDVKRVNLDERKE